MSSTKFRSFGLVAAGVVAGVAISLGITAVAQRPGPLPLDELRQFSSVFAIIKNNYVEEVEDSELLGGAIAGMVSDLDPHSAYLDAEAFRDMQSATQGEFGGLGIEVGTRDGFVSVIAPIEDTPAARAGVMAGDLIIKIDETPTQGMSLSEAVDLMRGKPGTPIVLTLMREDEANPVVVRIVRDVIRVRSVRGRMLDNDVAYVRVSQFQEKTGADLVEQLRELGQGKSPEGLVLDLRNDPGGLLNSAIGVAGAFLPRDALVVSTKGRTPDANQEYRITPADYLRGGSDYLTRAPAWAQTVPMVVLVNGGSASASEIVAGALQDYDRAQVLGTRTFGKGSVQVILPISRETAIKLTTSRYYTPKGNSIQATGIEPDFHVTETPEGDLFQRPREADLLRHLSNDQERLEIRSQIRIPNGEDRQRRREPVDFGSDSDHQLQQALNVLQGDPVQESPLVAQADGDDAESSSSMVELPDVPGIRMKVEPLDAPPERAPAP